VAGDFLFCEWLGGIAQDGFANLRELKSHREIIP
jgi:hypothetical protein